MYRSIRCISVFGVKIGNSAHYLISLERSDVCIDAGPYPGESIDELTGSSRDILCVINATRIEKEFCQQRNCIQKNKFL